ncbi:phosphoribosylanthranilate isomerase [Pseudomonas sp. Marseille-QA0892]
MTAVRSKICGITRVEDALAAADAGADAIGLVFYAKSGRAIDIHQARRIIAALPPFVTTVGLFVDHSRCEIGEILDAVPLDLLQFHGDETPEECMGHGRPYMKALRMRHDQDIAALAARYTGASGILLDTYVPGVAGGTGETFDWSKTPSLEKPLVLAGGLTCENVGEAIRQVSPFAVDVSGGVEASQKGVKDADLIRRFVHAVKHA